MGRAPTESEIKEFTRVRKWRVRHPGTSEIIYERCSFAEIEYRYFEGFNIMSRVNLFGVVEPFEKAHARIRRYYELDYEYRREMRIKPIAA